MCVSPHSHAGSGEGSGYGLWGSFKDIMYKTGSTIKLLGRAVGSTLYGFASCVKGLVFGT
jgi:hypothetical protein